MSDPSLGQTASHLLTPIPSFQVKKKHPTLSGLLQSLSHKKDSISEGPRANSIQALQLPSPSLLRFDESIEKFKPRNIQSQNLRNLEVGIQDPDSGTSNLCIHDIITPDLRTHGTRTPDLSTQNLRSQDLRVHDLKNQDLRSLNLSTHHLGTPDAMTPDLRNQNQRIQDLRIPQDLRTKDLGNQDLRPTDQREGSIKMVETTQDQRYPTSFSQIPSS
jgi:hypothetical protein